MFRAFSTLAIAVYLLIIGPRAAAAPNCAEILSRIGEQRSSESKKLCFFGQCSSVTYVSVSETLDIIVLPSLVGSGISLKYKEEGTSKDQVAEGIILKQDKGEMTILTESGVRNIRSWEVSIYHLVVFKTSINPTQRVRLTYNNFLARLDLLATENANDFIHFDIQLNRDSIDMVAKISKTNDGFLFEFVDGSSYAIKRSLVETAYERGGDYQVMKGLQNSPI